MNKIRKDREWYYEFVDGNSITMFVLNKARHDTVEQSTIKRVKDTETHLCIRRMTKRGLVKVNNKTIKITQKGIKIHLANHLGISPLGLLILSKMYAKQQVMGFYIKSYSDFHPIFYLKIKREFTKLIKKHLVCKLPDRPHFWVICDIDSLKEHHHILVDISKKHAQHQL